LVFGTENPLVFQIMLAIQKKPKIDKKKNLDLILLSLDGLGD
jgi:hypothetical protein